MTKTRYAVALALILVAWGLWDASRPHAPLPPSPLDSDLFQGVIDRVRGGESYYIADANAMRTNGYPTASVFNWRLPTLTLIQARLPSRDWSVGILTGIGLLTATLWSRHFRRCGPLIVMGPVLLVTLPVWPLINGSTALLHDLWAGQLIALSLACWASGAVWISMGAALAALAIRELTVPYVLVMAVMAIVDRDRKEAIGWLVVLALFALLLVWHVAHARLLLDVHSPYYGWSTFGGWPFVLKTTQVNVLIMQAPEWVVALAIPLLWLGFLFCGTPTGRRVGNTVTAYLATFTVVGRPDNWYWGLLVAPLLPLGALGWLVAGRRIVRRPGRPRSSESQAEGRLES